LPTSHTPRRHEDMRGQRAAPRGRLLLMLAMPPLLLLLMLARATAHLRADDDSFEPRTSLRKSCGKQFLASRHRNVAFEHGSRRIMLHTIHAHRTCTRAHISSSPSRALRLSSCDCVSLFSLLQGSTLLWLHDNGSGSPGNKPRAILLPCSTVGRSRPCMFKGCSHVVSIERTS
jgi:hypothetical protein